MLNPVGCYGVLHDLEYRARPPRIELLIDLNERIGAVFLVGHSHRFRQVIGGNMIVMRDEADGHPSANKTHIGGDRLPGHTPEAHKRVNRPQAKKDRQAGA